MRARKYTFYICGSISVYEDSALKPLSNVDAHMVLGELIEEPLTVEELGRRTGLSGEEVSRIIGDLLRTRVVRKVGDKLRLNICVFTRRDIYRLREVGFTAGEELADLVVGNLDWVDPMLKKLSCYPYSSLELLRLVVIGAYTLDLCVLKLLFERGLALCSVKKHPGGEYVLFGREVLDAEEHRRLLRGVYYGCHSDTWGRYTFRTFGDHSGYRHAFPDVVWSRREPVMRRLEEVSEDVGEAMEEVGLLLERIACEGGVVELERLDVVGAYEALASLLLELEYIARLEAGYKLLIPVLTPEDMNVVKEISARLSDPVMRFIEGKFEELRSSLEDLRAGRWADFREVFTEAWHWIFGAANSILANRGYMAKPTSKGDEAEYVKWLEITSAAE